MKAMSMMIVVLFLTGCGNMGMSGRSDMGRSDYSVHSELRDGFDPNNPYHGG
jgi:hypothetical protein